MPQLRQASREGSARPVTMRDIAHACGVSTVTVSHALRGTQGEVSAQVRTQILSAAKHLGYDATANHAARQLVAQRQGVRTINHLVGFFFPFALLPTDHYHIHLFDGLLSVLSEARFGILAQYAGDMTEPDELLPYFARGEVDGAVVLAAPQHFAPILAQLRECQVFADRPVVSLCHHIPGCSSVVTDDRDGAYQAARHLLQLGHRHLLCADNDGAMSDPQALRCQGYRQAYLEQGLDARHYLHAAPWCQAESQASARHFLEILRATPEITGILAYNDTAAVLLYDALHAAGLRIPGKYSLLGYDGVETILDDRRENCLTTIALPLRAMGQDAARLLLRHIGQPSQYQTITHPVSLVIRGTTAPPRR